MVDIFLLSICLLATYQPFASPLYKLKNKIGDIFWWGRNQYHSTGSVRKMRQNYYSAANRAHEGTNIQSMDTYLPPSNQSATGDRVFKTPWVKDEPTLIKSLDKQTLFTVVASREDQDNNFDLVNPNNPTWPGVKGISVISTVPGKWVFVPPTTWTFSTRRRGGS